jgi:hypothetical protein
MYDYLGFPSRFWLEKPTWKGGRKGGRKGKDGLLDQVGDWDHWDCVYWLLAVGTEQRFLPIPKNPLALDSSRCLSFREQVVN